MTMIQLALFVILIVFGVIYIRESGDPAKAEARLDKVRWGRWKQKREAVRTVADKANLVAAYQPVLKKSGIAYIALAAILLLLVIGQFAILS